MFCREGVCESHGCVELDAAVAAHAQVLDWLSDDFRRAIAGLRIGWL